MTLAVTLAFGSDVWTAFFATTKFTRTVVLEQGGTGWYKIQSVFSWVRMWGGGIALAYTAQAAVTAHACRRARLAVAQPRRLSAQGRGLLIGTLLATPYSLDYDLMLLAPAIAYLAYDGFARGFGAYEKSVLAGLWIVPLVARSVPQATLIPLAVPMMLLALAILLRRAINECGAPRPGILRHVP